MNNYIQIKIENISSTQSEMLIAQLSEINFEGFEEEEDFLSAYIEQEALNEIDLKNILSSHHLTYSKNFIEQKNWNEEWEKNFEPVIIDDFAAIRAAFHKPVKNVEHEIIITPKMSFGTGHHATTFMMIQQMRNIDFKNKSVFDFGTGTGILAILAEKLGAEKIIAIDNDEWSINNAKENIERNNCKKIQLELRNSPISSHKFEVILANISKNVILQYLEMLSHSLTESGQLLVSGLLKEDEADILNIILKLNLRHIHTFFKDKWMIMRLSH
ncbi:MAG TPA: 50S ribosomal protein L11 methyltransferase [Chitinophagaceae bacterium]|jgi:ribosomal protein L11 methyltransferase